jgi:PAS domain S-box-containing protein
MSQVLSPVLFSIAGVCAYAALHHGLLARRRPVERTHLAFGLLCVAVGAYIVTKALAYQADSAEALVSLRRWEAISIGLILLALPHFVAQYTCVRPRWLLFGLNVCMVVFIAANLVLPYGSQLVEFPQLQHMRLPWGEEVVDLRVHQRGPWHKLQWAVFLVVCVFSIYACARQYWAGAHYRALHLARGLILFVLLALFNLPVNLGLVEFIHTGEFGFLALVLTMSLTLTRELRENKRRMQAVLDQVPAVVYLKDGAGRYLWANRRHAELTGVANGVLTGKTDLDLFPRDQAEAFRANDAEVLASRQAIEFEEMESGHGKPRIYSSLKFPLLDEDGRPYAVCGVSTDITELRKARTEMNHLRHQVWHADRVERMGAITASLAHELSQPLTAVLSNAQAGLRFLNREKPDLEELRAILQDIVRDDKRAATVIAGLRAMLRQQETPRETIDLGRCVAELLELMKGELLARAVVVECGLATSCRVLADKAQIQQVVLNLVMNAVEAMERCPESGRHLWVELADTGEGEVRVTVCDDGEGIPDDLVGKVFDGFFTTKAKGLGMGLAVCRSIVESHGGEIGVRSNADRGVSFFFTLPLRDASNGTIGPASP